jgi:transposase
LNGRGCELVFIKTKVVNNKTYLSVAESYRENGKIKTRIIASLGCIENFKHGQLNSLGDKLKRLSSGADGSLASITIKASELEELNVLNWGGPKIIKHLWNLFGLEEILGKAAATSKIEFDVAAAIFSMVLNRLLSPSSKLKVFENQSRYVGVKNVDLQHFYRALDFLCDQKNLIEKAIFEKNRSLFNMKVDIVFYDVTTLYFESQRSNDLKDFGYSKDCKFNEVQIVLGLLVDREGRPVGYDVFPGNTFEGKTLETALIKLKKKFNIDKIIIVADRGMNSKFNLQSIRAAGYDYIVGCKLRKMPKNIKEQATDIASYNTSFEMELDGNPSKKIMIKMKTIDYKNHVKIKEVDKDVAVNSANHKVILDEKIVLTWSSTRAEKDKSDRQRLIDKAISILAKPSSLKEQRGAKRYIKQTSPGKISLRDDKIIEDMKWDGFYGISTSKLSMSDREILDAYKNLWRIEESFRVLKFSLRTRPIFHWNEKRIAGHLMVCFLSFLLERTLESTLRSKNIEFSVTKIQDAIRSLTLTPLSCQHQELYLRSKVSGLANEIFLALNIRIPHILSQKHDYNI